MRSVQSYECTDAQVSTRLLHYPAGQHVFDAI